jgi:dTDP-4-dehydrorhamnose 3,5-epimerase
MFIQDTSIPGVKIVELDRKADERGFFARGWCTKEFAAAGLCERIVQMNISVNRHRHTLRGFHYQLAPYQEDKLLRCVRGRICDALVDLRPDSPTYLKHITVDLSAENFRMLVVPKGCANAFLTLEDGTEVTYLVSEFYTPAAERGLRWDDPALNVHWPADPAVISDKDRAWPDYVPSRLPVPMSA